MPAEMIKVLRHGKGTHASLSFRSGKGEHTLTSQGAGIFLGATFETEQAAAEFCAQELGKDPTAFMYILEGNTILKTVLDKARQHELERKSARRYEVFSTIIFSAVCLLIVTVMQPFEASKANLALAIGLVVMYLLLLMFMGRGNVEAAILMTFILILLCLSIPALKRVRARTERLKHSMIMPTSIQSHSVLCLALCCAHHNPSRTATIPAQI